MGFWVAFYLQRLLAAVSLVDAGERVEWCVLGWLAYPSFEVGGECVTREHIRHNMSGIAHQGRSVVKHSRISHAR